MPLTIRQAAERLGVQYNAVWSEIQRGNLPAFRVGSAIRIQEGSLEAYISANAIQPAPAAKPKKTKGEMWQPGMRIQA